MQTARKSSWVALVMLIFAISGCANSPLPQTPLMYDNLGQGTTSVNPQAALDMLNAYRLRNGLNALEIDEKLNAAAQEQADAMAKAVKVNHALSPDMTLPKRMNRAGFDAALATENIAAGYYTLAEAFSGFRDSSRHNKNMLREGVTHMGIATQYRGNAKYKVFWCLILAKPDDGLSRQPLSQTRPSALFAQ